MRIAILLAVFGLMAQAGIASAQSSDRALIDRGRYLAIAGDCAGCHGTTFAGGDPVPSPIGDIYAPNITPDAATGIGTWSQAQFSDTLRKGMAPDGHLYPAMPYTSYTGVSDDDIAALYAYFLKGVDPVVNQAPETNLPFPFFRSEMVLWNALFLKEGTATGAFDVTGDALVRGRQLVESLGHCSGCHTPRGAMMQQVQTRHLGGAMVDGWWAPNITTGPGGIGDWPDAQLAAFLRTGHAEGAVAAGDMGTVVSRSLSLLEPADIDAIVRYLRAVPPVASATVERRPVEDRAPVTVAQTEPVTDADWQTLLVSDTNDGALLYQSACAACHGGEGQGSANGVHPSLRRINSVVSPQGATLVQVIAHGVNRKVGSDHALMPGFRDTMNDTQIASLATFVRSSFGGVDAPVTAAQVADILSGRIDVPWIIRNAMVLAVAGLIAAASAMILIFWWGLRILRRSRSRLA